MVSVWQMGILLAGIGFLILCIFAATTLRDLGSTMRRIERIIADKNGEIESIIEKSVSITDSVDVIAGNVSKATNVVGVVSSLSSGLVDRFARTDEDDSEAKKYRKPKTKRADLSEDNEDDEVLDQMRFEDL